MADHDHNHDHPHSHDHAHGDEPRWKHDGVRVITGDKLDSNTAQTPGMFRQAAINHARVGAQKIRDRLIGIVDLFWTIRILGRHFRTTL